MPPEVTLPTAITTGKGVNRLPVVAQALDFAVSGVAILVASTRSGGRGSEFTFGDSDLMTDGGSRLSTSTGPRAAGKIVTDCPLIYQRTCCIPGGTPSSVISLTRPLILSYTALRFNHRNLRLYSRNPDLNFHSCYQFPVGARIA